MNSAGQYREIKAMLLSDAASVKYAALRMPQAKKWPAEVGLSPTQYLMIALADLSMDFLMDEETTCRPR